MEVRYFTYGTTCFHKNSCGITGKRIRGISLVFSNKPKFNDFFFVDLHALYKLQTCFFFIIYRTILGSQLARSLLYHSALSWLLIKSQLKYIVFSGLLDNLYNERKSKKSRSCNWKNNVIEMALKFLSDSMEEAVKTFELLGWVHRKILKVFRREG